MGILQQLRVGTKRPSSGIAEPTWPPTGNGPDGQLEVALLFTSQKTTIGALERAADLLSGLNARITLIAAQIVPYPLALDNPPVSVAFHERRLLQIAVHSPVETAAHLYLCRNRLEMLTSVLKPGSVLIIGVRKRWWGTWERTLARQLGSAGLHVILLELS